LLLKSKSPRIIHIGSVSAIGVPSLETYAYSASKAGLHHLSKVLAVKLGKRGVRVNTIACGAFESKMMKATLENVLPSQAELMVVWGGDQVWCTFGTNWKAE
jgi:NAD(P)-dependent dehydrogenase (short-subunit alcohol dehydrogenase family)